MQHQAATGLQAFAAGRREEGITALRAAADREARTDKHVVTPGPLAPARELLAWGIAHWDAMRLPKARARPLSYEAG